MAIMNVRPSMYRYKCVDFFNNKYSGYVESIIEITNKKKMTLEEGFYTPHKSRQRRRGGKIIPAQYDAKFWWWIAAGEKIEKERKLDPVVGDLLQQRVDQYKHDASVVDGFISENKKLAFQRKIFIGYGLGEQFYSGLVLFDGSTKLFDFHEDGKMTLNKGTTNSKHYLEEEMRDIALPERQIEQAGEDVNVFFISSLTALPDVVDKNSSLYRHVAKYILFKVNPDLLESKMEYFNKEDMSLEIQSWNRQAQDSALIFAEPAPIEIKRNRVLELPDDQLQDAYERLAGVRIYASTVEGSILRYHQKAGWKLNEVQSSLEENRNVKLIYFDAQELIMRYYTRNSNVDNDVQFKGELTRDQILKQRIEELRLNNVLQRGREKARRLKNAIG
ncbi:MAG: hypothetical protein HOO06_11215 [Bdellovibrionaceae bacterium]|nr:hypothetical protein [Pseudobdellovibrionaceae bacterium]